MSRVLAVSNGPVGRACLLEKMRPAGAHAHRENHVLIQIEGGHHDYHVGNEIAVLDPDHAVLVNSHELHSNLTVCERSIMLMLYFSPEWIETQFPALPAYVRFFPRSSVRLSPALRLQIEQLARQMQSSEDDQDEAVHHLFESLAENLCHSYGPCFSTRQRPTRINDFRIRRAIALMRENLEEPLATGDLASKVGLSRSRFFELFSACTGLSPKHYLNMIRLEMALQFLADDPSPIAELSQRCGFGAQSHFSKFFVDQQGFRPRDYRRVALSSTVPRAPSLT